MANQDPPIDLSKLIDTARNAQLAGNWAEALRGWEQVCLAAPGRIAAILGTGEALRELGRFDEADRVLTEAVRRFPDSMPAATAAAETAQLKGDLELAFARWQEIRDRFPDRPGVLARVGAAFSAMGRFDEADALLAAATARFPKNEAVATAFALSAQRRGDAAEALKRWEVVQERFPDNTSSQSGIEFAKSELNARAVPAVETQVHQESWGAANAQNERAAASDNAGDAAAVPVALPTDIAPEPKERIATLRSSRQGPSGQAHRSRKKTVRTGVPGGFVAAPRIAERFLRGIRGLFGGGARR